MWTVAILYSSSTVGRSIVNSSTFAEVHMATQIPSVLRHLYDVIGNGCIAVKSEDDVNKSLLQKLVKDLQSCRDRIHEFQGFLSVAKKRNSKDLLNVLDASIALMSKAMKERFWSDHVKHSELVEQFEKLESSLNTWYEEVPVTYAGIMEELNGPGVRVSENYPAYDPQNGENSVVPEYAASNAESTASLGVPLGPPPTYESSCSSMASAYSSAASVDSLRPKDAYRSISAAALKPFVPVALASMQGMCSPALLNNHPVAILQGCPLSSSARSTLSSLARGLCSSGNPHIVPLIGGSIDSAETFLAYQLIDANAVLPLESLWNGDDRLPSLSTRDRLKFLFDVSECVKACHRIGVMPSGWLLPPMGANVSIHLTPEGGVEPWVFVNLFHVVHLASNRTADAGANDDRVVLGLLVAQVLGINVAQDMDNSEWPIELMDTLSRSVSSESPSLRPSAADFAFRLEELLEDNPDNLPVVSHSSASAPAADAPPEDTVDFSHDGVDGCIRCKYCAGVIDAMTNCRYHPQQFKLHLWLCCKNTSLSAPGCQRRHHKPAKDPRSLHKCTSCGKKFSAVSNLPTACRYHPGSYEWDSYSSRWWCCENEDENSPGCRVGPHLSSSWKERIKKRAYV